MAKKGYDTTKKVTLLAVTNAFIEYTTSVDLTRSEYLLIQNVFDVVLQKLRGGDVDD